MLDKLISGATSQITKNPIGIGAAALGLGMNMFKGQGDSPEEQALREQAARMQREGGELGNYLKTGTLPPGMRDQMTKSTEVFTAQLEKAKAGAQARVISNHARNGMSTDPTRNSALAQELASIDMNAATQLGDMQAKLLSIANETQMKLLTAGIQETGLATKLYEMLVNLDRQKSQSTGNAIMNFAAALGGSGRLRG